MINPVFDSDSMPEFLLHQSLLIKSMIDLNKNHDAVALSTALIEDGFQKPLFYFLRGMALLEEGNAEQALHEFQEAVQRDPQFEPAWYQLGQLYLQRSELDKAHEILRRLEKNHASNPHIYHFLGLIAHIRKENEKAIRYWQKALRIQPDFIPAIHNLKSLGVESDTVRPLDESIHDAEMAHLQRQVVEQIREIEVIREFRHEPYEIYYGRKGLIWISTKDQKSFTYLQGTVHLQEISREQVKELVKILESMIISLATNHEVEQIFWELDFGKGQYFIYYREKISGIQWQSYHEGRLQTKKVPLFFKFRIISPIILEDLKLNGNIFLIEMDKRFYLMDNLGTDLSYTVLDTLDKLGS